MVRIMEVSMKTDNSYTPLESAGTDVDIEDDDLAPPLSITEAAKMTRKFIKELPDDMVDADLGDGL